MAMPSACPTVRIILRIPEAIPTFSGGISRIPELIAGPITSPKAKPVKHNRIITGVIELSYRMYPYKYVVIVKPSIPRPESQMPPSLSDSFPESTEVNIDDRANVETINPASNSVFPIKFVRSKVIIRVPLVNPRPCIKRVKELKLNVRICSMDKGIIGFLILDSIKKNKQNNNTEITKREIINGDDQPKSDTFAKPKVKQKRAPDKIRIPM